MQIVEVNVNDLNEYENNPRLNDDAVEYVARSIESFGFKNPIIIDSNNVIIAGHTRLKAAKFLGMDTVPCIVADDLSEEQIKAFRLADNKVGEIAQWDMDALKIELDEIKFDMEEFGFIELTNIEENDDYTNLDISDNVNVDKFNIIVDFEDEDEAGKLYDELTERGYKCRVSTL